MRYRLLIAVLVCTCVGVALGAAVKIKSFTPDPSVASLIPDADGMAILTYHDSPDPRTEIQVMITNFEANDLYYVWLDVAAGQDLFEAPLITNAHGNANVHVSFHGNQAEGLVGAVIYKDTDQTTGFSPDDEIWATGTVN